MKILNLKVTINQYNQIVVEFETDEEIDINSTDVQLYTHTIDVTGGVQ